MGERGRSDQRAHTSVKKDEVQGADGSVRAEAEDVEQPATMLALSKEVKSIVQIRIAASHVCTARTPFKREN